MKQVAPDQGFHPHQTSSPAQARRPARRRRAARALAVLVAAVMIIDSSPSSWSWLAKPRQIVSAVTNRIGLWQGEWSMFAPDPALNNGWFSAEIEHVDGTQTQWNSPLWSQVDSGEKFLRFRYLNYYNRLVNVWGDEPREDLADYLARQSETPVASVRLYHARMRLILPDDGTLPKRDEAEWMFSSEPVASRTYSHHSAAPTGSRPTGSQPIDSQQQ